MRLRGRALASAAGIVVLMALRAPGTMADNPPACPSPSPGAASSARTCVNQSPSPVDQLKARLNADLASALASEQTLSRAVSEASATEQLLSNEVALEETRVTDLQDQISQLDQQISDLDSQIAAERDQVAALARAMYRRPTSFLDIIASSGNLSDALTATADMIVAGQRAHALQEKLQADLTKVQADRDARQSDLDQENATLAQAQSGLDQLATVQSRLDDLTAQLTDLVAKIQSAAAQAPNQPADVTAALAQLLENDEQNLAQEAQAAAWAQANAGAGMAADLNELPAGAGPAGIALSWPMRGAQITQPFGPTSFVLEPPLGPYPHFHTGIDIAAAFGAPVFASGDGIVVAVAHTWTGYGNYVIVAHGSGVLTLYGHLYETDVTPGARVVRGQQIGREGSSGYSTGPHLHFEVRVNGKVTDPMRYLPPLS
jgi:murein DD-endopeptidase MepM/ murein hydrolase activator NlpD